MYLKILLLSICFAGTICSSFAQQKDVIDILHADTYAVNMKSNIDSLLGNVRLKHKNMLMFCDKLYNHRDSNYVEAFGNVHVIQNDTLNLWGDFMLLVKPVAAVITGLWLTRALELLWRTFVVE